jgi:shikimate dehydrogenase
MISKSKSNSLLAGVIGYPISQSKSPKLHNYWLNQYKINGFYIPITVKPEQLKESIASLILLGFRGVNVTIPHKTEVLSISDTITDRASLIGASNTLYFSAEGKITADNTDAYGFIRNIYHHYDSWEPKKGPAVVFGAGGAAKAVVYALLAEGVPRVKILNRTKVKAELIAENLGNKVEVLDWYSVDEALRDASTVVNTTSLGMVGQAAFQPNLQKLPSGALVTDLVYNPTDTEFLKSAKKAGHNTVDGLGMLLYQAEIGFTNWFNCKPEVSSDLKLYILRDDA